MPSAARSRTPGHARRARYQPALDESSARRRHASAICSVFFQLLSHSDGSPGCQRVAAKTALVPLVHEERPIYTAVAGRTLTLPRVLLVNTDAEAAAFGASRADRCRRSRATGVGLEQPTPPCPRSFRRHRIRTSIIMGRGGQVDRSRRYWRALVRDTGLPPVRNRQARLAVERCASRHRSANEHECSMAFRKWSTRLGRTEPSWDLLRGAIRLVNPWSSKACRSSCSKRGASTGRSSSASSAT